MIKAIESLVVGVNRCPGHSLQHREARIEKKVNKAGWSTCMREPVKQRWEPEFFSYLFLSTSLLYQNQYVHKSMENAPADGALVPFPC